MVFGGVTVFCRHTLAYRKCSMETSGKFLKGQNRYKVQFVKRSRVSILSDQLRASLHIVLLMNVK